MFLWLRPNRQSDKTNVSVENDRVPTTQGKPGKPGKISQIW